jgi:thiol-disulfide isomerase/thioredoxin
MRMIQAVLAVTALSFVCAGGQTQERKIVMTQVKYDGLKQEILKHRGKVVIVDFWRSDCRPCIGSFPKFVKMYEKHAAKGLVIVTVSIDRVNEDNDGVKAANRILNDQKLPFIHLNLNEPDELLMKQFSYESLPFYYVFDRRGKWTRFRAIDYVKKKEGLLYEELENLVVQVLAEK